MTNRRRMPPASVSVITVTRGRPKLLWRALASIGAQRGVHGILTCLVVVDDCDETRRLLSGARLPPWCVWTVDRRQPHTTGGPARLAALRNAAWEATGGSHVAFLDDDNEWTPGHVALLQDAVGSYAGAAHSHRTIWTSDGRPYLDCLWPWRPDRDEAQRRWELMCRRGVTAMGSNVYRDRADPLEDVDGVRTVDTSEWLITRDIIDGTPFPTHYDRTDWEQRCFEDGKLLRQLLSAGIRPACTRQPTLRYYLGGYSNSLDAGLPVGIRWAPPERGPVCVRV